MRGGTVPKFDQQKASKRSGVSPAVTKPQWNSNFDGRKTTKITDFVWLSTAHFWIAVYGIKFAMQISWRGNCALVQLQSENEAFAIPKIVEIERTKDYIFFLILKSNCKIRGDEITNKRLKL